MSKFNIGDFVSHKVSEEIKGVQVIDGVGYGEIVDIVDPDRDLYKVLFPVEDSVEKADMTFTCNGTVLSLVSKPTMSMEGPTLTRERSISKSLDCWPAEALEDGTFPVEIYLNASGTRPLVVTSLLVRKCNNKIGNSGDAFIAHIDYVLNDCITLHSFSLRLNADNTIKLYAPQNGKYPAIRTTGESREATYIKLLQAAKMAYDLS